MGGGNTIVVVFVSYWKQCKNRSKIFVIEGMGGVAFGASFGAEVPMKRSAISGIALLLTAGIAPGREQVAFEVASVKLSQPGPNGWMATRITFAPGAQRFTAVDASLRRLIMMAYDITDRFSLTLHSERKDLAVEALSLRKHGLKLQPASDLTGNSEILIGSRNQGSLTAVGRNVTLSFLAQYLSARLHRIVVDRTSLAGSFDFMVELPLDREDVQDLNLAERDVMAHVFGDLVNSLGFIMQPQKSKVEVFTVEHVELPVAN